MAKLQQKTIDNTKDSLQNELNYSGEDLLLELDQELDSETSPQSPARSSDMSHLPGLPNRQMRMDKSIDSHVERQVLTANSANLEMFGGRNKILVGASTVRKPTAAINYGRTSVFYVPHPKPGLEYRFVYPSLRAGRIVQIEEEGFIVDTEQTPDGSPFWAGDQVLCSRTEEAGIRHRQYLLQQADNKDPGKIGIDDSELLKKGSIGGTKFQGGITTVKVDA